eukprot:CAMPEP_0180401618 /NCGR_PEP_ID=MMETSP0989-20121125/38397_1 /TAXON_ID=697907 /ORGANISM="non described non described, Strain CCMP2293" /LENGTH=47 /DNA_ID= /DNA_START= /DNA_END= /DNA_ORIENTATION=
MGEAAVLKLPGVAGVPASHDWGWSEGVETALLGLNTSCGVDGVPGSP